MVVCCLQLVIAIHFPMQIDCWGVIRCIIELKLLFHSRVLMFKYCFFQVPKRHFKNSLILVFILLWQIYALQISIASSRGAIQGSAFNGAVWLISESTCVGRAVLLVQYMWWGRKSIGWHFQLHFVRPSNFNGGVVHDWCMKWSLLKHAPYLYIWQFFK